MIKAIIFFSIFCSLVFASEDQEFYDTKLGKQVVKNFSEVAAKYGLKSEFQTSQGDLAGHSMLFKERDKMRSELNVMIESAMGGDHIGNTGHLVDKLAGSSRAKKERFLEMLSEYSSAQLNTDNLKVILHMATADLVAGNYISKEKSDAFVELLETAGLYDKEQHFCESASRLISFKNMNCYSGADRAILERNIKETKKIIADLRKKISHSSIKCSGVDLETYLQALFELENTLARDIEGWASGDCGELLTDDDVVDTFVNSKESIKLIGSLSEAKALVGLADLEETNHLLTIGGRKVDASFQYLSCSSNDDREEALRRYAYRILGVHSEKVPALTYVVQDFKAACGGQAKFMVIEPIHVDSSDKAPVVIKSGKNQVQ